MLREGSGVRIPLSPRHERRVSYSKISECVLKTEMGPLKDRL